MTSRRQPSSPLFYLLGALGLLYLALVFSPRKSALVGDEMWAATAAMLGPIDSLTFLFRFDPHPPLYYVQLDLWALVSQSDAWLLLNSAAWQLLLIALVYRTGCRLFDRRTAIVAAILVGLSPALVFYAVDLRMYSMFAALSFWAFDLTLRVTSGAARRRDSVLLLLVETGLILSYVTGPLFVFFHVLFGFWMLWERFKGTAWRPYLHWTLLQIIPGLLSLGVTANSLLRGNSHAALPDGRVLWDTWVYLFGGGGQDFLIAGWLAGAIVLAGTLVALRSGGLPGRMLIFYLLLPFGFFLLLSYAIRPTWLDRAFLFASPLALFAIAGGLRRYFAAPSDVPAVGVRALAGAVILIYGLTIWDQARRPPEPDYREIAGWIEARLEPDSCVYLVDGLAVFWGVSRYLAGRDWGDPLSVQMPTNERWQSLLGRIPVSIREWSRIEPDQNFYRYRDLVLVAGDAAPEGIGCADTVWVGREDEVPPGLAVQLRSGEVVIAGRVRR